MMCELNASQRRSERIVTCVYCGHEYPDGTPASQDEKLTEHIKICKKHPMRDLEQQLAAAKAELAAEREAKEKANQHYSEQYVRTCRAEQRADIAEEKAKRLIKKLTYNTPSFRDGECNEELLAINENELVSLNSCMCDRLEQAEAQCVAMQTAINRYVFGNIELLDALKAALEDKPIPSAERGAPFDEYCPNPDNGDKP